MNTPRTQPRKKFQKELQLDDEPESETDAASQTDASRQAGAAPREDAESQAGVAPQSGIVPDQPPTGDARRRTTPGVLQVSETYSGPLPHPAIIKQYNEIQPDFAERLLRMAEDQQAHRHSISRAILRRPGSVERLRADGSG